MITIRIDNHRDILRQNTGWFARAVVMTADKLALVDVRKLVEKRVAAEIANGLAEQGIDCEVSVER